jgi:6-pyruvoyltetrahydropterin/6-carboxytetrahydropterin synthase
MQDSFVQLTRRVTFSSGHRYWSNELSAEENQARFGRLASPFNHGHNFVLDVTIRGEVDPTDGMVINIKRLDELLKVKVLGLFDGKSVNDEIPPFKETPPTIENLLQCIWEIVSGDSLRLKGLYPRTWRWDADMLIAMDPELQLPDNVRVVGMRLEETPKLFGEIMSTPFRNYMTLSRSYEFAASHRLHVPTMSKEKNLELFGKCNNPAGHGHNYVLEVTVEGLPDPISGRMVDLDEMDRRVAELVVERYDHRNLSVDIPELKDTVATTEVVAQMIFARLEGNIPGKLQRIRLFETARNCFEVSAAE